MPPRVSSGPVKHYMAPGSGRSPHPSFHLWKENQTRKKKSCLFLSFIYVLQSIADQLCICCLSRTNPIVRALFWE